MAELPRSKVPNMGLGNVIFEFSAVGNAVKVCAIDPDTGLEVSIVGPVSASEEALRRTAMSKLRYMLDKRQPSPLKRGGVFA
ncbi:MAG: hypothetical protein O3B37_15915 [Proteobacteria bacterium]|nr:hypothetical protein [Pseudomonadota bacterium]